MNVGTRLKLAHGAIPVDAEAMRASETQLSGQDESTSASECGKQASELLRDAVGPRTPRLPLGRDGEDLVVDVGDVADQRDVGPHWVNQLRTKSRMARTRLS